MIAALLAPAALWVLSATLAHAQDGGGSVIGEWVGKYTCAQGVTGVRLVVTEATPSDARALFHFYEVPENPGVPEGCFTMTGRYDSEAERLQLTGEQWLKQPPGWMVVNFNGTVNATATRFTGRVAGGPQCTTFDLEKRSLERALPQPCRVVANAPETQASQMSDSFAGNRSVHLAIEFAFGKDTLTQQARRQLDELGRLLTSSAYRDRRFAVIGHTDSVGSAADNQVLSERRARAAANYLIQEFGIPADRLSVAGKGESDLLDAETPESGANRRVEIRPL